MDNFINSHKKIIETTLMSFMAMGSIAAMVAIAKPALMMFGVQLVYGAPDNLFFAIVNAGIYILPFVPYVLVLGAMSALLYVVLFPKSEGRVWLTFWGLVMLGLIFIAI